MEITVNQTSLRMQNFNNKKKRDVKRRRRLTLLQWNDPEISIEWSELVGEYDRTASAEGYALKDGTKLNLSEKDQKWVGVMDTFKF